MLPPHSVDHLSKLVDERCLKHIGRVHKIDFPQVSIAQLPFMAQNLQTIENKDCLWTEFADRPGFQIILRAKKLEATQR